MRGHEAQRGHVTEAQARRAENGTCPLKMGINSSMRKYHMNNRHTAGKIGTVVIIAVFLFAGAAALIVLCTKSADSVQQGTAGSADKQKSGAQDRHAEAAADRDESDVQPSEDTYAEKEEVKEPWADPFEYADTELFAGKTVNSAYPRLSTGCLGYAHLSALPKGVLLKCGDKVISSRELHEDIQTYAVEDLEQIQKMCFFVLEHSALGILFPLAAEKSVEESGRDLSQKKKDTLLNDYIESVRNEVEVTQKEIREYYEDHRDMFENMDYASAEKHVGMFLLEKKQNMAVRRNNELLSLNIPVEVSASWTAVQAENIKQTFLEKKRANGMPSVAVFNKSSH